MGALLVKLAAMVGIKLGAGLASIIAYSAIGIAVLVWYDVQLNKAEEIGRKACESKVAEATAAEQTRVNEANDKVRMRDEEIKTIQEKKANDIREAVNAAIKQSETNRRICWDADTIRNINRVR